MIRILQISDIHWRESLKNLDTFKPIQDGLIADLKRAKKKGITFNRILICGDVAFSGAKVQYKRAKDYIQELCKETGCEEKNVYVVPGNHDKEWSVPPKEIRELINCHVEELKNADKDLSDWLQGSMSTVEMMYSPFKEYEAFAYKLGCAEPLMHRYLQEKVDSNSSYDDKSDLMYWVEEDFAEIDGYTIKLYGLNTALYSDAKDYDDAPERKNGHKMLLSRLAYNGAKCEDGTVNILMMHHPVKFLKDAERLKKEIDNLYHIQFYGHVHVASSDNENNRVHIFSGALQPDEMGASKKDYMPIYNIVEIDVEKGADRDTLKVKLEVRYWNKTRFVKLGDPHDYQIEMQKNDWEGEVMELATTLPDGVTKRDVRLKFINSVKAKRIINEMDSHFYDDKISPYYNIMRFLEKVRVENLWGDLWNKMKS